MILKSVKTIILILLVMTCTASELNKVPLVIDSIASFYHQKFQNRLTANGDRFDNGKLTAAYNHVSLGTELEVCHEDKCVIVKVNDRISKKYNSRIDLSKSAFRKLAHTDKGLIKVQIKEIL